MFLLFAVSTSRFSPSRRPLPSDPTIRICLCDNQLSHDLHVHTTISPAILPSSQSVSLFFIVAGLLRHSVHIQKTPRVSFPHTHKPSGTSFLPTSTVFIHLDPKPEQYGSHGERPASPLFWLSSKRFSLRLGPIDYVCVPVIAQLRCIASGSSQTCTIVSLPWHSQTSIPHRDS